MVRTCKGGLELVGKGDCLWSEGGVSSVEGRASFRFVSGTFPLEFTISILLGGEFYRIIDRGVHIGKENRMDVMMCS